MIIVDDTVEAKKELLMLKVDYISDYTLERCG